MQSWSLSVHVCGHSHARSFLCISIIKRFNFCSLSVSVNRCKEDLYFVKSEQLTRVYTSHSVKTLSLWLKQFQLSLPTCLIQCKKTINSKIKCNKLQQHVSLRRLRDPLPFGKGYTIGLPRLIGKHISEEWTVVDLGSSRSMTGRNKIETLEDQGTDRILGFFSKYLQKHLSL